MEKGGTTRAPALRSVWRGLTGLAVIPVLASEEDSLGSRWGGPGPRGQRSPEVHLGFTEAG